jgi:polynucleotide 5'-hydroxyl-kinase GRC3/NOL9
VATGDHHDWKTVLDRLSGARRILVLGATDVGKSSFIREVLQRRPELRLLDLDPGQKMIGAPGTVSLGRDVGGALRLERFRFIGTTSASSLSALTRAGSALADDAQGRCIANTSGFVRGLGERLQLMTIEALEPDLIVAIEEKAELQPILASAGPCPVVRVPRSPAARRKGEGERRRLRQSALDDALSGATRREFHATLGVIPAPPAPFEGTTRPLCSLVDGADQDMCIGVLEQFDGQNMVVHSVKPPRPPEAIRLGKMWCERRGNQWRLVDGLKPSWRAERGPINGGSDAFR